MLENESLLLNRLHASSITILNNNKRPLKNGLDSQSSEISVRILGFSKVGADF